ncbi:MAG: hypothetical protein H6811_04155 [Phycisphaeraceae bacterium]|nr:hypothetical protein [Phycisphaeraceae bacterium]
MTVVEALLIALLTYAAVGLCFAIPFVVSWVKRVDPVAAGAPLRVRLLFLPGAVALWPVLWPMTVRARSRT